jgi:hypothetical protein
MLLNRSHKNKPHWISSTSPSSAMLLQLVQPVITPLPLVFLVRYTHTTGLLWMSPSQRPAPNNRQHSQETAMPPAGFEPTISAGERPQTHAATRIGPSFRTFLYLTRDIIMRMLETTAFESLTRFGLGAYIGLLEGMGTTSVIPNNHETSF